jgi:hypothetical protein
VDFWSPQLVVLAEAIRKKVDSEICYFSAPGTDNGSFMFGFIDNTIRSTARPGGGL